MAASSEDPANFLLNCRSRRMSGSGILVWLARFDQKRNFDQCLVVLLNV